MIALINASIFAFLGFLHLYWAFGGQWGLAATLPATKEGTQLFRPGILACIVVALGLLGFAAYSISLWQPLLAFLPDFLQRWGIWAIAGLFMLRSIGDFRYVGFFKEINNTLFAQMDTRYYSPLCAWLALSNAYIGLVIA